MKPTRAIILRHQSPVSYQYALQTAQSCDAVGLPWHYYDGYSNMTGKDAWGQTGIKVQFEFNDPPVHRGPEDLLPDHKANCASAGHAGIWTQIAKGNDEAVVVLEHDAMMLQPVDIDVPERTIGVLGYKVTDPQNYRHIEAGPPKTWIDIDGHEGAHAYVLTKDTAQYLVDEIETQGVRGAVDNIYFIRGQRRTRIPLKIASPTPAIGWIRESTIWADGQSATSNYRFINSFDRHYSKDNKYK